MRASAMCAAMLILSACSLDPFDPTVGDPMDSGSSDAGGGDTDSGGADAAAIDAAGADAGDAGGVDAAADDAGPVDAGPCGGREVCDGVDNDCDPTTVDGSDDPMLGAACDGMDTDMCADGTFHCITGALACDDDATSASETCNAIDDDCDGTVDEGGGCSCPIRYFRGEPYLFCGNRREWDQAESECVADGYTLATITDMAEHDFVAMTGQSIRPDDWWIGLNDLDSDDVYQWTSGSTSTFRNFAPGEPGENGRAVMIPSDSDTRWVLGRVSENRPYVCDRD